MMSGKFRNTAEVNISGKEESWWRRNLNWKRVGATAAVVLLVFNFVYGVWMYHYVSELNTNQEMRLIEVKKGSIFITIYYKMHGLLGNPLLLQSDLVYWKQNGKL